MSKLIRTLAAVAAGGVLATGAFAQTTATATASPGQAPSLVLVPKFVSTDKFGKLFDQAHKGAETTSTPTSS